MKMELLEAKLKTAIHEIIDKYVFPIIRAEIRDAVKKEIFPEKWTPAERASFRDALEQFRLETSDDPSGP